MNAIIMKIVYGIKVLLKFFAINSVVPVKELLSDKDVDSILKERLNVECQTLIRSFPHVFSTEDDVLRRYYSLLKDMFDLDLKKIDHPSTTPLASGGFHGKKRGRPRKNVSNSIEVLNNSNKEVLSDDSTSVVREKNVDNDEKKENNSEPDNSKNRINKINNIRKFARKENVLKIKTLE